MSGNDSDSEQEYEELKEEGKLVIQIKPIDGKGEVTVKLKRDMRFEKVFTAFESKVGIDEGSHRYLYHGQILKKDTTPKMLEMKIGRSYVVEAMPGQTGGSDEVIKNAS